jgi:hypothetical protein
MPPTCSAALAFPHRLAAPAQAVAKRLAIGELRPPLLTFSVFLNGEELIIPQRVYYAPEQLLAATRADGIDGLIALCLGTRHHDGFVREHCLRRLLGSREDWIIPFVVQLAGEYVSQIVSAIEAALPELDGAAYGAFLRENPRFFAKTERRVISYWYAYAQAGYRERGAEPGSRVIAAFKRMAASASASRTISASSTALELPCPSTTNSPN